MNFNLEKNNLVLVFYVIICNIQRHNDVTTVDILLHCGNQVCSSIDHCLWSENEMMNFNLEKKVVLLFDVIRKIQRHNVITTVDTCRMLHCVSQ